MTDTSELEFAFHELETLGQGLLDLGLAMEGCNDRGLQRILFMVSTAIGNAHEKIYTRWESAVKEPQDGPKLVS